MPGHFCAEFTGDEAGDPAQFVLAIVMTRDHEGRDLEPDTQPAVIPKAFKHTLERCTGHLPVCAIGKPLQVDIGRIQVRGDRLKGLGGRLTVGDEDILDPGGSCCHSRIVSILEKDGRFGIGVGNAG